MAHPNDARGLPLAFQTALRKEQEEAAAKEEKSREQQEKKAKESPNDEIPLFTLSDCDTDDESVTTFWEWGLFLPGISQCHLIFWL